MTIPVFEYLNLLNEQTLCPTGAGELVQVPRRFASLNVFVFDDASLDEEFTPFWLEYLKVYRKQHNQPLQNNVRRGICDEITMRCVSLFKESARMKLNDVEATAAAFQTRGDIPGGLVLNNVEGPVTHEFILVATTKNQRDVTLYAYEEQNGRRVPLAPVCERGLLVTDQWV